jgi:drug/metabolite transporter (DMT)-like permease
MNDNRKAHLAVLAANLLYGANFSIAKIAMPEYIKPSGFILLRAVIASFLFWVLCKYLKVKDDVSRKDMPKMVLLGLFGVALNQLLFFEGLSRTSNINAALIMTSNPILVLVVAALIIRERITGRRIWGIVFGVTGAAVLILMSHRAGGHSSLIGDTMIFINAFSYAIYMVMVKPLMKKYSPWTLVKYTFIFGTLLVIPFGFRQVTEINWASFTAPVWMSFLFVIIGTTFFAYFLNIYGLRHLSPAVVSFYIYLQPIFATGISLALLGEPVTFVQVFACLLIFVGVYLVSGPAGRIGPQSADQRSIS